MNFYIPIQNGQALSTKRLKTIQPFLPTQSVLQLHCKVEALCLQQYGNEHTVEPYFVKITKSEMDGILKEIRSKVKYDLNELYLLIQSKNLPIAKIIVENE